MKDRPAGPVAEMTQLPADGEVFVGAPEPFEPADGYVQEEFAAAGRASSFSVVDEQTGDGEWTLEPGAEADYTTRIVVRRPEAAADFSGVVVVEWMNVSGGIDAGPQWTMVHEEIEREGHAWVGVSVQLIGVEGGPVPVEVPNVEGAEGVIGKGLVNIDPERYGTLSHPGDTFSNDIFTQVGRAVRAGGALGDLEASTIIAAGQSQSAFALVTYINGVHPLTEVYDGYFLHSRGAAGFPVMSPDGEAADIAGSLGGEPTIIRTDLDVPVFDIQAENDVVGLFGSHRIRQPDSDVFRLWEMAGTAHADTTLTGSAISDGFDCGAPINDGPMNVIAKAAFHHLVDWVVDGTLPPPSQLLELVEGDEVTVERDADGIAIGGVRTPPVEVPVAVLSGIAGPKPETICLLSGSTLPLPAERLAELYLSADDYLQQFDEAVAIAVEDEVVLEDDRVAIDAYARPDLIAG